MKTLTKLLTATTLTIGLVSNPAYANKALCDANSNLITMVYTNTAEMEKDGLLDKSNAFDLFRTDFKNHLKRQNGSKLQASLVMADYAFDYVDKNYEKMKLMSDAQIKRIGYKTCREVKSLVGPVLNSNK